MRFLALISGGKDSMLAAWLMGKQHSLACFGTIIPQSELSYMFHHVNAHLTLFQSIAAGLPICVVNSSGMRDAELEDLRGLLSYAKSKFGIDAISCGVVKSKYQYFRISSLCEELGLRLLAPLWDRAEEEVLGLLLENGFEVVITRVAAQGLTREMLGKKLDSNLVDELLRLRERYKFSLVGEGGEYETFVLDCPLFKRKLEIGAARIEWDPTTQSGNYFIESLRIVPKSFIATT